ncbi:hypothetical protein V1505DRAFT_19511 [Lipomyces doorenjongii]
MSSNEQSSRPRLPLEENLESINDEFARLGKPQSLQELQELALLIDARYMERQLEKGRRPAGYDHRAYHPQTPSSGPEPMQLDAATATAKQETEKMRRSRLGLCWTCGDKGHRHGDCPKSPKATETKQDDRQ